MSVEMAIGGCLRVCPVCHVTAAVMAPTVISVIRYVWTWKNSMTVGKNKHCLFVIARRQVSVTVM